MSLPASLLCQVLVMSQENTSQGNSFYNAFSDQETWAATKGREGCKEMQQKNNSTSNKPPW